MVAADTAVVVAADMEAAVAAAAVVVVAAAVATAAATAAATANSASFSLQSAGLRPSIATPAPPQSSRLTMSSRLPRLLLFFVVAAIWLIGTAKIPPYFLT